MSTRTHGTTTIHPRIYPHTCTNSAQPATAAHAERGAAGAFALAGVLPPPAGPEFCNGATATASAGPPPNSTAKSPEETAGPYPATVSNAANCSRRRAAIIRGPTSPGVVSHRPWPQGLPLASCSSAGHQERVDTTGGCVRLYVWPRDMSGSIPSPLSPTTETKQKKTTQKNNLLMIKINIDVNTCHS